MSNNTYNNELEFYLQQVNEYSDTYKIEEYEDKNKKIKFNYFEKKSFEKDYLEDVTENINIVGDVRLWKSYKEDEKDSIGRLYIETTNGKKKSYNVIENRKDKDDSSHDIKDIKSAKHIGYLRVGRCEYVRVLAKPFPIIIILLGCVLIGGGIGVATLLPKDKPQDNTSDTPTPTLAIEDAKDWDGQQERGESSVGKQETTEIPGYANLYANDTKPNIVLHNPNDNTVYFKYTIYNGDKVLFESKLIEPGKMVEWDANNSLEKGEYELTFAISCYDIKDQSPCNGANQTVKVSIGMNEKE